jgi:outer membrane immunogenic protein
MRLAIATLLALISAPSAFAADLDYLRGSESVGPALYKNWTGFYAGGDIGYIVDGSADFSRATGGPIAYALRVTTLEQEIVPSNWPVLGTAHGGAATFGGFVGYNTQWQDVVLGFEGTIQHTRLSLDAPSNPISRRTPGDSAGNVYDVTIVGDGTLTNLDYLTLRSRAGWVLGNFLPYGFVGFTLGRADLNISTTISGIEYPPGSGNLCGVPAAPCVPFSFTGTGGQNGEFLYGVTLGGGLDFMVTPNIFVRGEFEYIRFAPVADTVIAIAAARVGAGVRF